MTTEASFFRIHPTTKQEQALDTIADHKYTLLSGGSRSGKTYICCYALVKKAISTKCRQVILRFHFTDVKQAVGMDTLPKLLDALNMPYELNRSEWVFTLPNGSEIWLAGLDDKERSEKILGKEFTTIYFNEASQISYASYQMALTRLAENSGQPNRILIDCNPPTKDHWLYALFIMHKNPDNRNLSIENEDKYGYLDVNPLDNAEHLPEGYIDEVLSSLDERQRARFRDGLWLDKRTGALWSYDMILSNRIDADKVPDLERIVVAVDPAVTSNEDSDETGIVVAGRTTDGHYYVLGDYSMSGTPAAWGRRVVDLYRMWKADRVVAEVNQGGDLVEANIRSVDRTIPYKQARATRGKALRAEPIASLYEQGLVHHAGQFRELETQMVDWSPDAEKSPDRMDALVWALADLSSKQPAYQRPIVL